MKKQDISFLFKKNLANVYRYESTWWETPSFSVITKIFSLRNEGLLHSPQSSSSPSDCLVPYPRLSLGKSYPSAEMQSVYQHPQSIGLFVCVSIYIYIYIEEYIFQLQVVIKANFIKDDRTLFIILNCNFSSLLVIFLALGSKWERNI